MTITKHAAYAHIGTVVICGDLTTEHSASSYNLPVFIRADNGQAIGPAECDQVSLGLDLDHFGENTESFCNRVVAAGYNVRA